MASVALLFGGVTSAGGIAALAARIVGSRKSGEAPVVKMKDKEK